MKRKARLEEYNLTKELEAIPECDEYFSTKFKAHFEFDNHDLHGNVSELSKNKDLELLDD